MDKSEYDRPEDESTKFGRGLGLLIGALAIVVIFVVVFNSGVIGIR